MKKTTFISILLVILFSFSIVSSAAVINDETVVPLWDNISTINVHMNFVGTEGAVTGTIASKYADELRGTLVVYKQTDSGYWSYVGSAVETTTALAMAVTVEFEGELSGYYKAVFTVTATKDGVDETVTRTTYRTCE